MKKLQVSYGKLSMKKDRITSLAAAGMEQVMGGGTNTRSESSNCPKDPPKKLSCENNDGTLCGATSNQYYMPVGGSDVALPPAVVG